MNKGDVQTRMGKCPICLELSMDVYEYEFKCRNCGYGKAWNGSSFQEIKVSLSGGDTK